MQQNLLILAAIFAAVPTLSQARPLILPDRDVAVEYHSRGMVPGPPGALTTTVMVHFTSQAERLRVDGPYGGFYALVDVDGARLIMVMPSQRVYVDQPADPDLIAVLQAPDPSFQKVGTEQIAGLDCTDYAAVVNGHSGQICLTDDGVLLRAHIDDPDRRPELEAVSVTYAPQPPWLFKIPAGFHRLMLPNLPFGLGLGSFGNAARDPDPGDQVGR
jgi:hypothetical protein